MMRSEPTKTPTAGIPLNLTTGVPPSLTKPVPLMVIDVPTQFPASSGIQSFVGVKLVIVAPNADPATSRADVTAAASAAAVRSERARIERDLLVVRCEG